MRLEGRVNDTKKDTAGFCIPTSYVLLCRLIHGHARTILKKYSESSLLSGSNGPALLAYPEPRNRYLKTQKVIREVSGGFCHRKASRKSFLLLQW
jgi:hypothetical protein